MKTRLSIFFLLFSCASHAQELNINTTRFVGGDSTCGYSEARYSIPTQDGGILFVGFTECFAGGGDIPSSPPDTSAETFPSNVLIGKLDSNMNVSWLKIYGGSWADLAKSAVQTPDGGYAVLAYTYSDNRDVSGNHASGTGDIWLIRIDSLGDLLWQKCYGSIYDDQPGSIAVTPDNGFIFYGISNGSGGDVPAHHSGSDFDYDWFIVKTDSAGNKQWAKSIGGLGDEFAAGSILSANNAYYLISTSNSTDYDCTDTAWCAGNGHGTGNNYYMFKLDTNGNTLWDSSYGGPGGDDAYQAIWDNRDSCIVINGLTTSGGYMVTGYNGGAADMWVIKTDRNGALKWKKCFGGTNDDEGYSIGMASFGYIAYGRIDPGSIALTDNSLFALDDTGKILSNKIFGGSSYENPYCIFPFHSGFAATGGSSSPGFTEGVNSGALFGDIEDVFISYINYWPVRVSKVNTTQLRIDVFPNPANETVTLLTPTNAGNLLIINCVGENVYSTLIIENINSVNIDVATWPKGMYIVKWQGEDGTVIVNKLIIN